MHAWHTPHIRRVRHMLVFICAAFLVLTAGCDDGLSPVKVDTTRREEAYPRTSRPVITYAYLPQFSHTVSFERHHRMVRYLSDTTGLNIQQIFPETFHEHMLMLSQGKIDISYANPFVYALTAEKYGARVFAKIVEPTGEAAFGGLIVARSHNHSIRTLEDCRGKQWIAVDRFSAGGYLFGLGTFMEHGIFPEDFAEIVFAPGPGGKQESVVLGVFSGRYDVGTVREGALELLENKIDLSRIKILAATPRYPGWNYAARAGLADETVEKIQRAMTSLDYNNPNHRSILENAAMKGIVPASPEDFNEVRELIRKAGIETDDDLIR